MKSFRLLVATDLPLVARGIVAPKMTGTWQMSTNFVRNESSLLKEVSFWSAWVFGTAASTVGLISFMQHVFDLQLLPAYAQGLYVYREIVHSILGWLYAPFVYLFEWVASWFHFSLHISIPGWWKDLTTLSILSIAALQRGVCTVLPERRPKGFVETSRFILVEILIAGVMLSGLTKFVQIFVAYPVLKSLGRVPKGWVFDASDTAYGLSVLAVASAAAIFFLRTLIRSKRRTFSAEKS